MRGLLVVSLLLLPVSLRAESFSIDDEIWSRPRSGEVWLRHPAVAQVLAAFERAPSSRIVLTHMASDDGLLWAEELRSWLVALGVPSSRTEVVAASAQTVGVQLEVKAP
jgi:hypothetical protein